MDAQHFTFTVSVPRDDRFAETVRMLAVQAARYSGCEEGSSDAFGSAVAQAVRASVAAAGGGDAVSIVIRRQGGPVEVLVNGHALILES